ncbi:MAG TPA: 30S ribosome-binding factor RbfA [Candidatus Saccharimonadales bacterium]|nr:30S ribosome-binding factor RbfA [Candidatus Saccharimonadales bacterium]
MVKLARDQSASHRLERINVQLRQELALAISSEVKDPRLSLVTVVSVSCAPDLSYARVNVSALGEESERYQALKVLRGMTGYLRHLLGERLEHMRRIPRLDIRLDDSIAYGVRVSQLLQELDAPARKSRGGSSDD